jgi:pimeloyl-ACP methyl ester carboxylesterase
VKNWWEKQTAALADGIMCTMMNRLQWQLRGLACTAEELENYLAHCATLERSQFFAAPFPEEARWEKGSTLIWPTPHPSGYPENDTARAEIFWCEQGPKAPTVFLLHALMSAHAGGYFKLARWWNARGWNAVFPHLPFHYKRVPRGQRNGALAVTANLIRNGEGLRQAVSEVRQLKAWLRRQGVAGFGLIGTSYGGWVGSLAASLEEDWEFLALVQPIANTERAIWDNPAAHSIRRILSTHGIGRDAAARHAHLTSPPHGTPQIERERIVLCAGLFDSVSPPVDLHNLASAWSAPAPLVVRQGHFGYRALPATIAALSAITLSSSSSRPFAA